MVSATTRPNDDKVMPIAIVGVAGRFPGDASDPDKLWKMLAEGRSARTSVPKDRYNADAHHHPHAERIDAQNFTTAHFMQRDPESFDAPFFQITPNEAKAMDPQQRMCLEVAYEALENAGIPMANVVKSQTSCYVGCFTADYKDMLCHDVMNIPAYLPTGIAPSCLSNRVSWFYDLRGPSMTVDTACSSSLIALHLACQSLRDSESEMSLVGGVNFMCNPEYNYSMSALHFLTPDGKCQSFDEKANGYARGEGASFLVIKPLEAALRNNDVIRAVIRNTGSNQDGNTPGITLPSTEAQKMLIQSTYARAGLDLADTGYFEAHGTGTAAGDPIETAALGATIGNARPKDKPLWVGSIKANIGHLEGASGMAGVVKAIHVLEQAAIPPQVWLDKLNPRVLANEWNLTFPRELTPWPYEGLRRASINSFGFGGANAHCILDDAYHYLKLRGLQGYHTTKADDERTTITPDSEDSAVVLDTPPSEAEEVLNLESKLTPLPKLAVFSSHEQSGIARSADIMAEYLRSKKDTTTSLYQQQDILSRFAYTLGTRRSVLPWKSYIVAGDLEQAVASISHPAKPVRSSKTPKIGLVFTGQGAQHFAMGRELWAYPLYRESLRQADIHLQSLGCGWSVVEELAKDEKESKIDSPDFSQPLCTVIQVALVDLLAQWGITPSAVVGHSSGEIAAAYAMGAITKEDAWSISYHRGRLSVQLPRLAPGLNGAMLAAGLGPKDAQKYIDMASTGKASVACVNSPTSVTISGDDDAIAEIEKALTARNIFARKLKVKTAYHSFHMKAIGRLYLDALSDLKPKTEPASTAKMFSSVTGKLISSAALDAQYWVTNMLQPVQFASAVESMIVHSEMKRRRAGGKPFVDVLLECGPHGALQGPLKQCLGERLKDCPTLSCLARGKNSISTILDVAGTMFQLGCAVDVDAANSIEEARRKKQQILSDIPPYPWNHNNKYWHESAESAAHRFREMPRNDLLGTLSVEMNRDEPSWRHFFRLSENPWIEDHSVHNTLIYPAAGMMVMALEAAAQIADRGKEVEGYELRDVLVDKALIIPREESGVETQFHLRPWRMGTQASTTAWNEFTIHSRPGSEDWSLNCSGLMRVVYKDADANPSFQNEAEIKLQGHREAYKNATANSTTPESVSHFYDNERKIGLQLGITFQNLIEINKGDGQTSCLVRIPDMAETMPMRHITPHVIHPCTLDAIVQTLLTTIEGRYERLKTAAIPTFIESLFVSSDCPSTPGTVFQTYSVAGYTGLKEAEASVYASLDGWSKPMVAFERIRATRLSTMSGSLNGASEDNKLRKITGEFIWKELATALSPEQITEICTRLAPPHLSSPANLGTENASLDRAAVLFAKKAVQHVKQSSAKARSDPHLQNLIVTLERLAASAEPRTVDTSLVDPTHLLQVVAAGSPDGLLLSELGKKLPDILDGSLLAHEVLEDVTLAKYARTGLGKPTALAQLSAYMSLHGHESPGMKILEVGCKTAAVTESVLSLLVSAGDPSPWFSSYTCVGEMDKPVPELAALLAARPEHMAYKKLDISRSLSVQEFEDTGYDIVIASYLSQSPDLTAALKNIKAILRPGGKLLLGDNLLDAAWFSLITSTLGDGVCRPTRSEEYWDNALKEAGFNGVETKLPSGAGSPQGFCHMVTTPASTSPRVLPSEVVVIEASVRSTYIEALSSEVVAQLRSATLTVTTTELTAIAELDLSKKACIVLVEADSPLLFDLPAHDFDAVRSIMLNSVSTTWVTTGGALDCPNPKSALITGLARTIRQENAGIKLATIDLPAEAEPNATANTDAILRVFATHARDRSDQEFAFRNGKLYVPRVYLNKGSNDLIATFHSEPSPEPGYFKQVDRALTLSVEHPGMLDTLYFKDDEIWAQPLGESEIEMEVKASGLNFMDIMVAMDQVQEPAIGLECSGIVTRVGASTSRFQVGDRVMTWLLGGFSNFARNDESMIQAIPHGTSFETAASLPMVYCTAYSSLVDEARLHRDDKVLIHAAAGGVGQAAIMLAQSIGAEIYATVGSHAKKEHIMRTYGIPEDHIFNSRDLSFADGIMRMTKGKGVDVVLNSLAGEALRLSWNCLAWFGRFVELGKKDITGNTGLDMSPFLRNISFHSVNVIGTLRVSIPRAARLFRETMAFFEKAKCSAVSPVKVMGFDETESAFRSLQSGKQMGKIVFQADPTAIVKSIPRKVREAQCDPNATYVLSGGLGGLGRSLCAFMVSHGAKNLAFISRSGAAKPEARAVLDHLTSQGVNARAYTCDIGDSIKTQKTFEKIQDEMPKIRGVLQAAMSLADSAYINMTHAQWMLSVNPKAPGTWNLHEHAPKDLDFFVMLSSSSGVAGNRGQGNYAAGNTFQDALAHFRRSQGLAAVALDIGPVLGAGYVAEHSELIDSLGKQGYVALLENEFLGLIQSAITGETVSGAPTPTQLISGFCTGGIIHAEGWDMPFYLEDPKLQHLRYVDAAASGSGSDGASTVAVQIAAATTVTDGADIVVTALKEKLAKLMMVSADDIDGGKPISTYGVDSLTAVEMRAWSFRELHSDISIFDIMSNIPIATLSRTIVSKSKLVSADVVAADL